MGTAWSGEIDAPVELSRPCNCLIGIVRDWANNWASLPPSVGAAVAHDPNQATWTRSPLPPGDGYVGFAGIDVHQKMLAAIMSDVEVESEYQFERRL